MAFVGDREDAVSMSLTGVNIFFIIIIVAKYLLEQYKIPITKIGRIDVGTESQVDKAKSIKSYIMDLFQKENTDIDG
jgi:hydroxymethylglutaryl-CoA synthase